MTSFRGPIHAIDVSQMPSKTVARVFQRSAVAAEGRPSKQAPNQLGGALLSAPGMSAAGAISSLHATRAAAPSARRGGTAAQGHTLRKARWCGDRESSAAGEQAAWKGLCGGMDGARALPIRLPASCTMPDAMMPGERPQFGLQAICEFGCGPRRRWHVSLWTLLQGSCSPQRLRVDSADREREASSSLLSSLGQKRACKNHSIADGFAKCPPRDAVGPREQ